jgi:hypothetical protein
MAERIGSPRDAASTLFNLPGYLVIAVGEEPSAGRWVDLEIEGEPHCSGCGVRGCGCIRRGHSESGTSLSQVRCRRSGAIVAGSVTTPPAGRGRSPRPPRRSRPTPAPPGGCAKPWSRR